MIVKRLKPFDLGHSHGLPVPTISRRTLECCGSTQSSINSRNPILNWLVRLRHSAVVHLTEQLAFATRFAPLNGGLRRAAAFQGRRRSGLALMVVLVALAIVSAIGMSLLKSAISQHRQAARDVLVVQARWLAESGIDRAAALLKADEKTAGFQWSVTAEQLGSRHAAKVTIEIKPV